MQSGLHLNLKWSYRVINEEMLKRFLLGVNETEGNGFDLSRLASTCVRASYSSPPVAAFARGTPAVAISSYTKRIERFVEVLGRMCISYSGIPRVYGSLDLGDLRRNLDIWPRYPVNDEISSFLAS